MPTSCTLTNATVDIDISHTYIGDLVVKLRGPSSTTVTLHDRSGSSADDLVGNYDRDLAPDGPGTMDSFTGKRGDGNWLLTVSDNASTDLGTLNCWAINLECQ